jgi:hypothetical protein
MLALLGCVAMIALAADPEASATILELVCPPGRQAHVEQLLPRAIAAFIGAAVFFPAANVVLLGALRQRGKHGDHPTV